MELAYCENDMMKHRQRILDGQDCVRTVGRELGGPDGEGQEQGLKNQGEQEQGEQEDMEIVWYKGKKRYFLPATLH